MIKNRCNLLTALFYMLVITYSCIDNPDTGEWILAQAENLIEANPDSALVLLNSIELIEKFPEAQKAKYHLLKIRAKDKCYEDISSDTAIFRVRDYYLQKGNKIDIALSSLYSGLVLFEQENNTAAMAVLLEAEKYANGIPEHHSLKGLIQSTIGHVFYRELLIDEATKRFKVAASHFTKSGEYANEAVSYNQIGLCFLMKKAENDSASFYLQKGLNVADRSGDISLKSGIRQNTGLLWRENGNPEKAAGYFRDALDYSCENREKAKIFYNMAKTYVSGNKIDSARYFIRQAHILADSVQDFSMMIYLHELDSKILKSEGKYREALVLNEEFLDYMEQEYLTHENKSILEIEKKYNYEVMRNNHNELLVKHQNWFIALLLLLIIFMILGISYYIKSYRNKKTLEEAEQKIISFTDMVDSYKQKNEALKQKDEVYKHKDKAFKVVLYEHFNILKKAALLEGYLKQEDKENGDRILRKFNEIIYGKEKLDWNILYDSMNKLQNGFLDSLHKAFPELDDEEFKVCCLIYNDFSNTEISIISGLSNRTITTRRSSIRKKIGIDDYGNINEYLKKHVKF